MVGVDREPGRHTAAGQGGVAVGQARDLLAAIRAAVAGGFTMAFDAMHAVTGPYAVEILERRLGFAAGTVRNGVPLEDWDYMILVERSDWDGDEHVCEADRTPEVTDADIAEARRQARGEYLGELDEAREDAGP